MSMAIQSSRARYQGTMPGGAPVGDPGLWGFVKGLGKAAIATVTGGPMAGIRSAVASLTPQAMNPAQKFEVYQGAGGSRTRPSFMALSTADQMRHIVPPGPVQAPIASGFRNELAAILPGGSTGRMGGPSNSPQPSGYHANKSSYFLKDGTFIPKGSIWVKNRRRNPLNPRALSSSMARITSFKGAASKAGLITIRKAGCKKKG